MLISEGGNDSSSATQVRCWYAFSMAALGGFDLI
jgi:hypothetical protein